MFAFHKPKVYRSTTGCCICKAKSSSSRFTDSKKYENDFPSCFQLASPRYGEICNACVLLVKRFKRLPLGSSRNWGYVVDARAGPGIKCMSKVKKRCEESQKTSKLDELEESMSGEELWSEDEPVSEDEDTITNRRRKTIAPKKNNYKTILDTLFINRKIWKKESLCCADLWRNIYGQTLIDLSSVHPCPVISSSVREKAIDAKLGEHERLALPGKVFNDNSSDSGYYESGNPSPSDSNVVSNKNDANIENKNSTNNTTPVANTNGVKYQRSAT